MTTLIGDSLQLGTGGLFGSVPEARVGEYIAESITSDVGVNPTNHYAFGRRHIPTLSANGNGAWLIGLENQPTFTDTGTHTGVQTAANYISAFVENAHVDFLYLDFIDVPSRANATIGELHGLYIQPMVGATGLNRAITTTGGNHWFQDYAGFGSDVKVVGGFGCNGASPQPMYPSGGALAPYISGSYGFDSPNMAQDMYNAVAHFRQCLVNNGMMSA
jgi:hypothetical protein